MKNLHRSIEKKYGVTITEIDDGLLVQQIGTGGCHSWHVLKTIKEVITWAKKGMK